MEFNFKKQLNFTSLYFLNVEDFKLHVVHIGALLQAANILNKAFHLYLS